VSTATPPPSSAFRPLGAPRNLTRELVERLSAEITGGKLAPGSKLPTEPELCAALGVSRTVIREAVAALRAEGLVVTRQGVGAFVASDVQRRPFRIDPEGLRSIDEVLEVMELRVGVESEAAGRAAERGTPAQVKRIGDALQRIHRAIGRGDIAVDQDFAFHHAIAEAANNAQFPRFLEFLGRFIIPRQSIRIAQERPTERRGYLQGIQGEHRAIFEAIRSGDATAARGAMRAHLQNSLNRYRRLATDAGAGHPAAASERGSRRRGSA
jgi:GntR family transcriptional repressor for pyruvate dehydrogenase complex